MFMDKLNDYTEWAPFPVRLLAGIIFLHAGISKLMNVAGTAGFFAKVGIPLPTMMVWIVFSIEILGGIALLLGLGTRYVAALLAIIMAVAAVIVLPGGFGNAYAPLFGFGMMLSLFFGGAGACSLDKKLCKKG